MYIFQKIEEVSLHYNDARKNIAEFLMNERSHAQNYSMNEISKMTFTSKATLSRFAQNVGFNGWTEFIQAYIEECHFIESHFSNIDPNLPFTQADNLEEMLQKIANLQIESIKDTLDLMPAQDIEKAGTLLLKSKKVAIFGLTPNTFLAELFQRKMESIGILVHIANSDEGGMISHALNSEDCAILISYSGNNLARIPMKYITALHENAVPIIGITSQGENLLRNSSTVCLTMSSRERLYSKIANYATEESVHFIFNALFSYCFSCDFQRNYNYKVHNSRLLEVARQTDLSEMQEKNED